MRQNILIYFVTFIFLLLYDALQTILTQNKNFKFVHVFSFRRNVQICGILSFDKTLHPQASYGQPKKMPVSIHIKSNHVRILFLCLKETFNIVNCIQWKIFAQSVVQSTYCCAQSRRFDHRASYRQVAYSSVNYV